MFTQFLGTVATVYGVLGALKSLLQTRRMLARRTSGEVSAGFLASQAGGYAIWLTYGVSTPTLPPRSARPPRRRSSSLASTTGPAPRSPSASGPARPQVRDPHQCTRT